MTVEFDVKLKAEDLFYFNMYQAYRGTQGILSIAIAVLVFVIAGVRISGGEYGYGALYILGGLLLLFYVPVSLKLRSKQVMKTNEVLSGTLHYGLSESGIHVKQGEDEDELPWNMVYKMISNSKYLLIYSGRINAFIIPRSQIEGQYSEIAELAKSKLEKFRVNLK